MSETPELARRSGLAFDSRVLAIQVVFAAVVAAALAWQVINTTTPDFAAFWAAHHVAHPYDPAAITRATGGPHRTFFPYPPPFLLMTFPLGWVSLKAGHVAWVALCAGGLVASLRRLSAPLVLAIPAVIMGVIGGQTSVAMGALLFAGLTLRGRPELAGALIGVAACVKPQAVVLVPLVLLAGGRWRMLVGAAAAGLALCLAATLAYGPSVWMDWIGSLPAFIAANDKAWTARYLALPGLWKIAGLACCTLAAVYAGRRGRLETGSFIAIAGALLGSLHAMDYDAAILGPFAVSAALSNRWFGLLFAIAAIVPPSPWSVLALAGLATATLLRAPPSPSPQDPGRVRASERGSGA